jgi:predicted ATPase
MTSFMSHWRPDTRKAETIRPHRLEASWRFGERAKSLELQASMHLSPLSQRPGTCVVARQLLAAIYSWFTEGFDTADLQEAKALLETLS